MGLILTLKRLFKPKEETELWVETEHKTKHRKPPVIVENKINETPEYNFGEIEPERVIIKETTYSILNTNVNGKKHLVYISTIYNEHKLTTLFTLEEFYIKEYPLEFCKLAIEKFVNEGCKHHESRIDFLDNYTVEDDIKLAIINEIYNQYNFKPSYLDNIKRYNITGCGGYKKTNNGCGGYAGPYCGG